MQAALRCRSRRTTASRCDAIEILGRAAGTPRIVALAQALDQRVRQRPDVMDVHPRRQAAAPQFATQLAQLRKCALTPQ